MRHPASRCGGHAAWCCWLPTHGPPRIRLRDLTSCKYVFWGGTQSDDGSLLLLISSRKFNFNPPPLIVFIHA